VDKAKAAVANGSMLTSVPHICDGMSLGLPDRMLIKLI
jgi:hypothetical protein